MNKHFHTAWILFKSIMSDLSGRIVSADSRIVEKVGKWNMEPSRLHKSLVKSFFFFFCCLIIVFFCLSFPPPSCYLRIWLKIKFHCHTHKFYMKGWEVLSVKRNTLICTHAQNWISFSLFLTYIFNKIMEVYSCQNISTSIVDILLTVVMREDLTTVYLDLQGIVSKNFPISNIFKVLDLQLIKSSIMSTSWNLTVGRQRA